LLVRDPIVLNQPKKADDEMRLLLLGHFPLDPDRCVIGPEYITVCLVRGLMKIKGVELTICSLTKGINESRIGTFENEVPVYHIPQRRGKWKISILEETYVLWSWIKRRKSEFDIINALGAFNFALPAVLSRIPTIYTVHGVESHRISLVRHSKPGKALLYSSIEKYVLGRIRGVIATETAGYTRRAVERLSDVEVREIPNPLSYADWNVVNKPVDGRILCVGTVWELKNQKMLISAMPALISRFPYLKLVLAGDISSDYARECLRLVEQMKLQSEVIFLGICDKQIVRKELSLADIFVLPSVYEVAPQSIAEAMAAGIPVVATDVGGVAGLVKDGETGFLINSSDENSLIQKVISVIGNRTLRHEFSQNAIRISREIFDPLNIALQTTEFIREITRPEYIRKSQRA